MALQATLHRVNLSLTDVDRDLYETLDLRLARHPSESARYLWTRLLAYALEYAEGIAFSKGGLSSSDEPPISIHDPTGVLLAWIDVGAPSAERLHKASKSAGRVALYTHHDLAQLRREAASRTVHRLDAIAVHRLEPAFLDALEPLLDRSFEASLVRNDGGLWMTIGKHTIEGTINPATLASE